MSTGFNPEQLKRIALAKRLARDTEVKKDDTPEPLPDEAEVKKHVDDMELLVIAAAEEGDLSFQYKFPDDSRAKLVNEVAIQFKTKHPRLMLIVDDGREQKSITASWDGLNHV